MLLIALAAAPVEPSVTKPTDGTNLALGKVVRFDPVPNYHQCRDDDDVREHTFTQGLLRGSNRWSYLRPAGQASHKDWAQMLVAVQVRERDE